MGKMKPRQSGVAGLGKEEDPLYPLKPEREGGRYRGEVTPLRGEGGEQDV